MNESKKENKLLKFLANPFVLFFIIMVALPIGSIYLVKYQSDNTPVEQETQKVLTEFPEDLENQKYLTLDAGNIFSEDFKMSLIDFEQEKIEEYLKEKTESSNEKETEKIEESELDEAPVQEYHFEYFENLSETEKKETVSKYVDAILSTIICEGYTDDMMFENAGAEKEEEKDLVKFMLNRMFESGEMTESLNEEYGTWYRENTNRTDFENMIQELQFVSVAGKNYICLLGEILACPDDVTDITKCDMSVTMIGKQENSYFYIVTDQFYMHQYLITFASTEEYSITLFE